MKKTIILIHGFMSNRLLMERLAQKFTKENYMVYHFHYNSRKYSEKTLNNLHELVLRLDDHEINLIGHSMGGLVARNYIHKYKAEKTISSLITIATPHYQSFCAHNANKSLKLLMGTAGDSGLTVNLPEWASTIPVGCIAGVYKSKINSNFFIMFSGRKDPSDGTIFVSEAILKNATDYAFISSSHTGILFKTELANQCLHFLTQQKFIRP